MGLTLWAALLACRTAAPADRPPAARAAPATRPDAIGGNVLVLVLDDVGIDKIGAWGAHPQPAPTPNLDRLAATGVRFTTVYGAPACSTSRAALLTGRYGIRTGFVESLNDNDPPFALPDGEWTVAEALTPYGFTTGALGKWHLASHARVTRDVVTRHGFAHFRGTLANLPGPGYQPWTQRDETGKTSRPAGYPTTVTADDALAFARVTPEPWFLWTAFHAAHSPVHTPPADLAPTARVLGPDDTAGKVDAMIEALDHEIGRLVDGLPPDVRARTTVFVVGDNGTADHAVRPPLDPEQAKLTVHELGVRVPLLVFGRAVAAPGVRDSLTHVVDLFPTIAEIAGLPLAPATAGGLPGTQLVDPAVPLDGISLLPQLQRADAPAPRALLYTEKARGNGPPPWTVRQATIRDAEWKLIRTPRGESLYHLTGVGLDEGPDRAGLRADRDARAAQARLSDALDAVWAGTPYAGW